MAKKDESTVFSQKRFMGIADYKKESANGQIPDQFFFSRAINYRDDPQAVTLLPASVKESGSVVTDLLKWADRVPATLTSYFYGNSGNIYQRTSGASWSNLHSVSNSHGNGMAYFSGDDYLYYTSDSVIGRYGPIQGTPQFSDNFLKAQGGVPTNTNSAQFVAASSQYLTAADSASLEITSDLTIETYFKLNSLPSVGNSMTLVGKWDESGATRGYKLDLLGISGFFADGTDGALSNSSGVTDAPIDSAATGTIGTNQLTATNAGFAPGQWIYVHQTRGTNTGKFQKTKIQSYTAGTITTTDLLNFSYLSDGGANCAQVLVRKRYTTGSVTGTIGAKKWNGTVGGIISYIFNTSLGGTGSINADGAGFRGGIGNASPTEGHQGESEVGIGGNSAAASGTGAGGGGDISGNGIGGGTSGQSDLTVSVSFGGGGGGTNTGGGHTPQNGGAGGGIVDLESPSWSGSLSITANGISPSLSDSYSASGSGAAGSIFLVGQTLPLGSYTIQALGGSNNGSSNSASGQNGAGGGHATVGQNATNGTGGTGGNGYVHIDYLTSYTATSTPTLYSTQDNNLVTTTTIQARLGISNDGTAFEYLAQNLTGLTTGSWNRLSVSWKASTSTARFLLNAGFLGTSVGTKTSISSNTSLLYVGANKTSVVANFLDGKQNDIRLWANVQTDAQIFANNQLIVNPASSGLKANYFHTASLSDLTSNANNLTNHSTTFVPDVPFPAATTRLDIDAQNTNIGQLYTLPTAISEASTDTLTFTPVNDPQASVAFYVDTVGTGDWTVTVHDQQNNVITTKTILNASIPTGAVEFIYANPWRLIPGKKYHMHLTVSTGTSKVVTGTTADFSTAEYTTYFGFLVPDTQFHPVVQFQYQPLGGVLTGAQIFGNERYLAVYDGANYLPNFLTFPPAWHVRCFGFWRQYLAIGMWRGGNIYDFDTGRIYFWSGTAPAFDFFIDVPEGQINALFGVDSDLYIFAGWRGYLLDYKGGFFYNTGNSESNKLKFIPKRSPSDYFEIYPQALTMWRGLLHFGLAANSNSTSIERGTYSFGTYNQFYPDTLSYDYVPSTGNRGNTISVGLVYPIGQTLIVGWQDGSAFGADMINFNNNPAASGELQCLISDDNAIWKEKQNFNVRADFLALRSGESVAPEISTDRKSFIVATPDATISDTYTKLPVSGGRSHEVQIGFQMFATGTTSPTVTGISLKRDELPGEEAF